MSDASAFGPGRPFVDRAIIGNLAPADIGLAQTDFVGTRMQSLREHIGGTIARGAPHARAIG